VGQRRIHGADNELVQASIDLSDLSLIALFQDLAALDALERRDPGRVQLLASALERLIELESTGGGSLGMDTLVALRAKLSGELSALGGAA
jgi:hypothetical protein